ncbi:MAG TPA: hypothetical protein VF516_32385 [Kofleriaceae bacterium]
MRRWTFAAIAGLLSVAGRDALADDPPRDITRLDLSVPDLPALVALNLSSDKVTRPSTPQDFLASIANGFSTDGSYHDGVAIEVSPFGLAGMTSPYATALRVSIATTAITSNGKTGGKAATGLRWSVGAYDPTTDAALIHCLADHLPHMAPPPVEGPLPPSGVSQPKDEAAKRAIDQELQACRDKARAGHLAQTALETAVVLDGTSTDSLKLTDLGTPHTSAWLVASWGWNSWDGKLDVPRHPLGIQPTGMLRFDLTNVMNGRRKDLFAGARLPFVWDSFGLFAEAGITLGDLSKVQSTSTTKTMRLGGGFDYRIADGSWLGVYIGQDFGDGAAGFSLLSNVKFQFGEQRQYGLR